MSWQNPDPPRRTRSRSTPLLITCVWLSALTDWWFSAANRAGESPQQLSTFSLTQELLFVCETAKYIYQGVLDALRRAAGEDSE